MPYFEITTESSGFPPAYFADTEGLLAVGGKPDTRLYINALLSGIFLWHHPFKQPQWWSPDPRMIIKTNEADSFLHISKNQKSKSGVQLNSSFPDTLQFLKDTHNTTWETISLTGRLERIYSALHQEKLIFSLCLLVNENIQAACLGIIINRLCCMEYFTALNETAGQILWNKSLRELKKNNIQIIDLQRPSVEIYGFIPDEISRLEYLNLCSECTHKMI